MALNDPQWGNKGSGGPPDLEEMLRNLNKKLSGMLGGGKGGGAPSSGAGPKGLGGGIALIVAIVVLVWIFSGFYIVDQSQRGVVLRFGKYLETTQAGARWHLPFPIETVEIVNLSQVRTVEVGYRENKNNKMLKESLMLTDDENIVDIQFAVQYYLKDPGEYLFNNRNPDENVRQAAETAIREVVGKNKMDFVLYEGRGPVETETAKLMQDILDRYKTGVVVSQVNLQNVQPPEQVQASFDDAVKAKQDKERQKNEGQAYANDVVPRAKGAAARLMQEADGYKQAVIASAEGDASRFKQILVQYDKAPQVTRERMYIDMMQQILSSTTKVLVDQKNSNSLLYLPFDKLMQSTNPGVTPLPELQPAAKPAEPAAAPESEAGALRSRDTALTRERGARP
jgi:membrane protease subunit HflK